MLYKSPIESMQFSGFGPFQSIDLPGSLQHFDHPEWKLSHWGYHLLILQIHLGWFHVLYWHSVFIFMHVVAFVSTLILFLSKFRLCKFQVTKTCNMVFSISCVRFLVWFLKQGITLCLMLTSNASSCLTCSVQELWEGCLYSFSDLFGFLYLALNTACCVC